MMSFDKYYFQRELWHKKLDEIEAKIDYRTIELVGHRVSVRIRLRAPYTTNFPDDERKIIQEDLIIQGLIKQRDEMLRRLDFITDRAEEPEAVDEAVKSWEEWEESKVEFGSKDEERSTSE